MSFSLYGPIRIFDLQGGVFDDIIRLAGDKIKFYRRDANRYALYDLNFNEITLIKSTYYFLRVHGLAVHRFGRSPEVYDAGYDCDAPSCQAQDGCPNEIDRYVYGSTTLDYLCPGVGSWYNTVSRIYYDAKLNKLLVDTNARGNALLLIDPDTGEVKKWESSNQTMQVVVVVLDDSYIYVVIKGIGSSPLEIRRYRVDEFYQYFGTGHIEDYGERVYYNGWIGWYATDTDMLTLAPNRQVVVFYGWPSEKIYAYDPEINDFEEIPFIPGKRYFGKYAISSAGGSLAIIDIGNMTQVQTIDVPQGQQLANASINEMVDPPFTFTYTWNIPPLRLYIYAITYNNVAPVIQYDHENRRIRVIDLITGNPLKATLWYWKSRFCYPRDAYPLYIVPETMYVDDWTPVPIAYRTECLTFAIADVYV